MCQILRKVTTVGLPPVYPPQSLIESGESCAVHCNFSTNTVVTQSNVPCICQVPPRVECAESFRHRHQREHTKDVPKDTQRSTPHPLLNAQRLHTKANTSRVRREPGWRTHTHTCETSCMRCMRVIFDRENERAPGRDMSSWCGVLMLSRRHQ